MIEPTRVLLLRHAETARPDVFHGAESDVGLSERGLQQIEQTMPVIQAERPTLVISSAMRRAIESAQPLADACRVPLAMEPTLHERRIGSLSGQPFNTPPWPDTLKRWMAGETSYAPDGAESFDDVRDRVLPTWERLIHAHAGKTSVWVVHGVVIRVLLLSLDLGMGPADWRKFHTPNLAINELVYDAGGWRIVRLADQRHLQDTPSE